MWKSVGVTHYQILPNNNIGATGTAYHLTLLKLFVYGHGQPLNSSSTSNNKKFSICASAILKKKTQEHHLEPGTLAQGQGPPLRAQNPTVCFFAFVTKDDSITQPNDFTLVSAINQFEVCCLAFMLIF